LFHYDVGLFLTPAQLAVDVRRRQPRCFVSHAHSDHIARHELALATSAWPIEFRPTDFLIGDRKTTCARRAGAKFAE
jgi:Cft2 family RNA processing exonuclease